MKRIVFAGGRDFYNTVTALNILRDCHARRFIPPCMLVICVSGDAKGADTTFSNLIQINNGLVEHYPAKWKDFNTGEPCVVRHGKYGKYNSLAGFNRNRIMGEVCEKGVVVWDGKSKGTKHMIDTLVRLNKPVAIYNYSGELVEIKGE